MKAFILVGLLAYAGQVYANGDLILTCQGQLNTEAAKTPSLGKKIKLEISQTPEQQDYRWLVRIAGDVVVEEPTNGPINSDGTSVAPTGEENEVLYQGLAGGILLKAGGTGRLHFIDEFTAEDGETGYELIEYDLSDCLRTGVEIDLREAKVWNAKSELADLTLLGDKYWLVGVGVRIGDSGLAWGLGLHVKDEAQQVAFIAEFKKRGLVSENEKGEVYYRGVPIEFTITGDVEPIP